MILYKKKSNNIDVLLDDINNTIDDLFDRVANDIERKINAEVNVNLASSIDKLNKSIKRTSVKNVVHNIDIEGINNKIIKHLKLTNINKKDKLKTVEFFTNEDIYKYKIYPLCPIHPKCDGRVAILHYKSGKKFLGCCNQCCKSFEFDDDNSFKESVQQWNNFVYKMLYNRLTILQCCVACILLLLSIIFPSLSCVLAVITMMFMILTFSSNKKIIRNKMNKTIQSYNLNSNNEISQSNNESSESNNEQNNNNSNVEILKELRMQICNNLTNRMIDDKKLESHVIKICNIVAKSIQYLDDNKEFDRDAKNLVMRFQQLYDVLNMYININKYYKDSETNNKIADTVSKLVPIFQQLHSKLLETKKFDLDVTLKVLNKDIDDYKMYHNL